MSRARSIDDPALHWAWACARLLLHAAAWPLAAMLSALTSATKHYTVLLRLLWHASKVCHNKHARTLFCAAAASSRSSRTKAPGTITHKNTPHATTLTPAETKCWGIRYDVRRTRARQQPSHPPSELAAIAWPASCTTREMKTARQSESQPAQWQQAATRTSNETRVTLDVLAL